jgi:myxalamid-type polyketide synthase MxaE and MxaD
MAPKSPQDGRRREVAGWLVARLGELLDLPAEQVPTDEPFTGLGVSSLQAVELSDALQRWAGVELSPTAAYDYPSVEEIAAHVAQLSAATEPEAERGTEPEAGRAGADMPGTASDAAGAPAGPVPVAIVGIGCRVPGADGPERFWQLLSEGVDAVSEVPADRWDADAFYDPDTSTPGRMNTRWGGFLSDVTGFDADFHGVSAREAARMDPQQRLVLDTAWEALEDAGIPAGSLAGSATGVFMGVSTFDHGTAVFGSLEGTQPYDGTGGALSIVANRLSYTLNLRGPSMVVDTACSSSLVAVHLACQALRTGEARLALAGGVNVITSPRIALSFSQSGLMAPDGRCKPFDSRADGYVRSEGVGVVVLKPLPDAVADGDRVYAVVLGGAVNQDGRTNGLTAPGGPSQEAVLAAACAAAGVAGSQIGYVEAHGTGTAVGDPIEVAALARVLGDRPAGRSLLIGSVKSNVGHLEAAAGVTGLIKTALALHHRRVPPTLHFREPNPLLGLDRLPVAVAAREEPWPCDAGGAPLPAGVSSFGFGGTNSHLVLAAGPAPVRADRPDAQAVSARPAGDGAGPAAGRAADGDGAAVLVPVSARSPEALAARAAAWAAEARAHRDEPGWLGRAAAAAALRTDHARYRVAVSATGAGQLADALEALAAGTAPAFAAGPREAARGEPRLVLVFPGQGSQWAGMGRRLAAVEPAFREAVREADACVARHLGRSLWSDEEGLVVRGTAEIQPALFAMQTALAATWRAWGLRPAAVVGHSMGEIAAAHAAGALSLADAAAVVCERSRLLTELSGQGGLLLAELTADDAAGLVAGREREVSVAALNGPRATVLSGTPSALDAIEAELGRRGVFARRIAVEFAAHSPQVEAVQPRLAEALAGLSPRTGELPLYSTVTGTPADGAGLDAGYWVRNVRAPVLFGPALERLADDGYDAYLEIAPHPVLARPVAELLQERGLDTLPVVSSLRRGEDESRTLTAALGELWTAGVAVDWRLRHPGPVAHVRLPGHGWRRRSFPLARPAGPSTAPGRPAAARPADGGLLGARIPVGAEPSLKVWQLAIGAQATPELADHVVEDTPVVAGAYWLAAAAQAGAVLAAGKPFALRDVVFSQPRTVREDGGELQLAFRTDGSGQSFTVTSCPPDGHPVLHARGTVGGLPGGRVPGAEDAPEAVAARCGTPVPVAGLYERLAAAGLRYGPRFRALTRLSVGDGEALARFTLPRGLPAGGRPLHPALLDSCLHTVAAAAADAGREGALPLPVGADVVWARTEGPPVTEGWCHVRLAAGDAQHVTADVSVLDGAGAPVWSATGFRVRLTAPRRPEDGRLYEVRWQPYEAAPGTAAEGAWLVLAGDPELRGRLAALAERSGGRALPAPAEGHALDAEALLDWAEEKAGGPLRGILDARAVGDRPGDVAEELSAATGDLLQLAQHLTSRRQAPHLWVFTADTQGSVGTGGERAPVGAALWGLGRTFANEYPEIGCTLVDLPAGAAGAVLAPLCAALRSAQQPAQLALRDGVLLYPELAEVPRAAQPDVPLAGDRLHVVTGGMGALGLRTAAWLASRGARHLLLLGRRAPTEQARQALQELAAAGCSVTTASVDLADRDALGAVLAAAGRPIGGVVHLAGVLEDALLPDLGPAELARAQGGKAAGAWHLHELTLGEPLELFVLFSSLAGLIGSPGQAAYASANTFLDALARMRAARGLPGQSIDWGPWGGDTLAASGGGVGRLTARGVPPLEPGTGVALLAEAVRSGRAHTAATALAPADLVRGGVWPAARALLAPLLPGNAGPAGKDDAGSPDRGAVKDLVLAAESGPQRVEALLDFLTEQVRQVLGAQPGGVPRDVPFQSLGFDSLMAIELRGRLETALDVRLSATLVYAHPTAAALAEQLLTRIAPDTAPDTATDTAPHTDREPAAPPAPGGPKAPEALGDLSALGDDEVAALLAAELAAFDGPPPEPGHAASGHDNDGEDQA